MKIILIVGLLVTILLITSSIVYFAIRESLNENNEYENFAKTYNYNFDKAMGRTTYRNISKNTFSIAINLSNNPLINKYANFTSYPFNRGTQRIVSYVICGDYSNTHFTAFNYQFTGSALDGSTGGTFEIIWIPCANTKNCLPDNVFIEEGKLCMFNNKKLSVDKLHDNVLYLKSLMGK